MRLDVTRKADLAIRALIALDRATVLKGAELGERLGAAPAFMAQVMAPLVRRNWVESAPGPTGGYRLLIGLEDRSILDVIEAVEGPTDSGLCAVRGLCGQDGYCALHHAWAEARQTLSEHLSKTSVAAAVAAATTPQRRMTASGERR